MCQKTRGSEAAPGPTGVSSLSIAFSTGRPIVFAGIGQNYDDLLQFEPTWLLNQLFE